MMRIISDKSDAENRDVWFGVAIPSLLSAQTIGLAMRKVWFGTAISCVLQRIVSEQVVRWVRS